MTERLDLPGLGAFLRSTAPASQPPVPPRMDASLWLELLAAVLGCSSAWLLETGRVDALDLAERGALDSPARLIRSLDWEAQPRRSTVKPSAPHLHISAETLPPAWHAARDTYLNQILTCRMCRAQRLKHPHHCVVGAELRQRYDRVCHQSLLIP